MYYHLKPGAVVMAEDTEDYQIVVRRSKAGWTEQVVWKPGHEPKPEPTVQDLQQKLDALTNLLKSKGLL